MGVIFMLLMFISLFLLLIFIMLFIVSLIKKDEIRVKSNKKRMLISLVLMIVSFISFAFTIDSYPEGEKEVKSTTESKPEEKEEKEEVNEVTETSESKEPESNVKNENINVEDRLPNEFDEYDRETLIELDDLLGKYGTIYFEGWGFSIAMNEPFATELLVGGDIPKSKHSNLYNEIENVLIEVSQHIEYRYDNTHEVSVYMDNDFEDLTGNLMILREGEVKSVFTNRRK